MDVDSEVTAAGSETSEIKASEKLETTDDSSIPKEDTIGETKKNGTMAAASSLVDASPRRENMSGIIVQLPEIFSLERDRHIMEKFAKAEDIRLQKHAFIECESDEAAAALLNKLSNSALNGKKVLVATRLDTSEKNVLFIGALKRETTDEVLKESLVGVEEIRREKYNTFVKFGSETECRAAKAKVLKDGINGQMVNCDFDLRKDRFRSYEEPPVKKAKEDADDDAKEGEEQHCELEEGKHDDEEVPGEEGHEMEEEHHHAEEVHHEDVKADEW